MDSNDLVNGKIYRFNKGEHKGSPATILDLMEDEPTGQVDVRYKITAGPNSGSLYIEERAIFASKVDPA